jgi:2-methylcitrate dehydratase PrpD
MRAEAAISMKHVPAVGALGAFVASTHYEDLPPFVQVGSKLRLLDALTGAFAGQKTPPTRLALGLTERLALAQRSDAPGLASYWLSTAKGDLEDCAFVNSILAHSVLLDDLAAPTHTSCVVPPSAIAVGEAESRTGAQILAAIALGYEVTSRVDSQYLGYAMWARGVRLSTVSNSFGVAATAAYLMELPAEAIADALAVNVALCASGGYEPLGKKGTSERCVQMGANARSGMFAAVLARAGFTGIDTAFEGDTGLYFVATGRAEPPAGLLEGLGELWHMDQVIVKPYPCASTNTSAIYCAESLVRDHGLKHEDIASIEVRGVPASPMVGVHDPGPFENFEQAIISCYFAVAATLVFGTFDVDVLLKAQGDSRVDALAQRIQFVTTQPPYTGWRRPADLDVKLGINYCVVTVSLRDGQVLTASSTDMPRSMHRPDWDGMVARFHKLTANVLSDERRQEIVREVRDLDQRRDCHALVAMLRSAG